MTKNFDARRQSVLDRRLTGLAIEGKRVQQ